MAVASFLVQTGSGIREGNEVQVEDESDFNVYASDAAMSSSVGHAGENLAGQLSSVSSLGKEGKGGERADTRARASREGGAA